MKQYIRYHGLEWLLCTLASAALLVYFAQGFYIPDKFADSVFLALAATGALLVLCYFGNYNRFTMVICSAVFALGFVLMFVFMRANGIDIVDEPESDTAVYIYVFAAVIIPLIVFLLSRSRVGSAALFLLGILLGAVIDYLGFDSKTWCAVAFAGAVVAMFLLRQYRRNALKGSTVSPSFGRFLLTAAITVAVAAALAGGLFVGVISPLNPPTAKLNLVTSYNRWDILERVGIAQAYKLPDDLLAELDEDKLQNSNEEGETPDDLLTELEAPEENSRLENDRELELGNSSDNVKALTSVSYETNKTILVIIIAALLVLTIVLAPILKRRLRARQFRCISQMEPRAQTMELYRFYLKSFGKLGFARSPVQTELEYVGAFSDRLAPYTQGAIGIEQLTDTYLEARYGGRETSDEARKSLYGLYPKLLENYRKLSGRLKYILKYFAL